MRFLSFLHDIGVTDLIDIMFVAFVIYTLFFWFKKTKAFFVFTGVLICSAIYVFAQQFRLHLAVSLMQGFFAVILVAFVVIFQEELRRFFEQVALWSLNPKIRRRKEQRISRRQADILYNTLEDLASQKIGALIVLKGNDAIERHLYGGVELGGVLSEALLKSIFDPNSPGHDGAVIVEDNQVTQFSAHLPLSRDIDQLRHVGTRHAAALGLAELSDALCLVVSEERGTVSAARHGGIRALGTKSEIARTLEAFYQEMAPRNKSRIVRGFFTENLKEKVIAIFVSLMLWFVFVHESVIVYKSFTVPVSYIGLQPGLQVTDMDPGQVKVFFSGARRDYYFVDKEDIKLTLKLFELNAPRVSRQGHYRVPVETSDLSFPAGLNVVNVVPRNVKVGIEVVGPPAEASSANQ